MLLYLSYSKGNFFLLKKAEHLVTEDTKSPGKVVSPADPPDLEASKIVVMSVAQPD